MIAKYMFAFILVVTAGRVALANNIHPDQAINCLEIESSNAYYSHRIFETPKTLLYMGIQKKGLQVWGMFNDRQELIYQDVIQQNSQMFEFGSVEKFLFKKVGTSTYEGIFSQNNGTPLYGTIVSKHLVRCMVQ